MSQVLNELLGLLKLQTLDDNLFVGQSQDLGFRALFGGQVIGQALSAARQTVAKERSLHSFHSYFLLPGDAKKPVIYMVEISRDGRSFSTRRVQAMQNGKVIFNLMASFQIVEDGFEHQDEMPDVPGPDGLMSIYDLQLKHKDKIPEAMHATIFAERPIEFRPVKEYDWLNPQKSEPWNQVWMRAKGDMPDDLGIHKYVLGYASDYNFLPTAVHPHGRSVWSKNFQIATIDHAMWFHRPFRFDDWLLYDIDSPSASGGRGLVRGKIFNRDGQLVASTIQEGVIRQR
ncbi:acyl-CoA thioesterase II [Thalassotalea sp. HSM 43]|uniref:acyl-CoA thioesterase II n=1 Tax=Thalassotalea sp. HSM 43 TaxID=2552945 RepID=UPI001080A789|nr:acyl-CoA thioesterase II [Thalassotalea sp. HSM 43]QBY04319.1 acyl-CoA thioesterase II [Thalassotalea sp. HSM 43]